MGLTCLNGFVSKVLGLSDCIGALSLFPSLPLKCVGVVFAVVRIHTPICDAVKPNWSCLSHGLLKEGQARRRSSLTLNLKMLNSPAQRDV